MLNSHSAILKIAAVMVCAGLLMASSISVNGGYTYNSGTGNFTIASSTILVPSTSGIGQISASAYGSFTTLVPPGLLGNGAIALTNGGEFYSAIFVPFLSTFTGACLLNGATVGTNKVIYFLANSAGTILANSATAGVTTANANKYQCIAFTGGITVAGPNLYFVGVQGNGATDTFNVYSANSAPTNYPTGTQTGVFGTVAAISSPATTFNANQGPLMMLTP